MRFHKNTNLLKNQNNRICILITVTLINIFNLHLNSDKTLILLLLKTEQIFINYLK